MGKGRGRRKETKEKKEKGRKTKRRDETTRRNDKTTTVVSSGVWGERSSRCGTGEEEGTRREGSGTRWENSGGRRKGDVGSRECAQRSKYRLQCSKRRALIRKDDLCLSALLVHFRAVRIRRSLGIRHLGRFLTSDVQTLDLVPERAFRIGLAPIDVSA